VEDLANARQAFETAIQLDPQYETAILNLASFHAEQVRIRLSSNGIRCAVSM